jgi:Endonuclease-reverse transcriptase
MPYLPNAYEALHKLDSDHHFGAAIVAKKALNCRFLLDHSNNHVVTALIELDDCSTLLRSLYLRPSLPSLDVELRPLLSRTPVPLARTLIGADANAKSSLWNSPCQNNRGRELEALLANFPLHVANVRVAGLTFIPPETQSIDITLVGNSVPIQNWHFPDIPSLSDHPYIYFELTSSTPMIAKVNRIFNVLPPLINLDKKKI